MRQQRAANDLHGALGRSGAIEVHATESVSGTQADRIQAIHLAEDVAWWSALCTGDDQRARFALDSLYRRHAPFLLRFATTIALPGTAEDVVQDVFISLWLSRSTIARQVPVRTYLVRAVRNGVSNTLRHQRRDLRYCASADLDYGIPVGPLKGPDEDLEHRELAAMISQATTRLPLHERIALTLRRDEFSADHIAFVLGVERTTVKTLLQRAFNRLRRRLVVG